MKPSPCGEEGLAGRVPACEVEARRRRSSSEASSARARSSSIWAALRSSFWASRSPSSLRSERRELSSEMVATWSALTPGALGLVEERRRRAQVRHEQPMMARVG